MKSMKDFLEKCHSLIGSVIGEICVSITIQRVPGGLRAMRRWANDLRAAADEIDSYADDLEERKKAIGR